MAYFRRGGLVERFTRTTASGGTTTLAANSQTIQFISGTAAHTFVLPDATKCDGGSNSTGGTKFLFVNRSTGVVTIQDSTGARLHSLNQDTMITLSLTDDTTAAGRWSLSSISYENQPLKLTANTGADSKIKIAPNVVTNSDGTDTQAPPVSNLIASVPLSTHDLQSGATSGATFQGTTAPTTTVGQYRRVGYNLLASGTIQVVFSAAATSLANLPNAGTVFIKTGLPIGWIDVEATAATAFKTIGSATAIVENMVGGVSRIHRFGAGGGGGGGTGDANAFQLELQDRLGASFFNCLTSNIISVDADKKINTTSSTGTYDTANSVYSLATVGQQLLSLQNYDATFLASALDNVSAELHALWGTVDPAATYEASRDGGLNWSTITMSRIGVSSKFRGIATFPEPTNVNTLASQTTTTGGSLNFSSGFQRVGVAFTTASKVRLTKLSVPLFKVNSGTGSVIAQIYASDLSTLICESTPIAVSGLTNADQTVSFTFTQPLLPGSYYVALKVDATFLAAQAAGTGGLGWRTNASAPGFVSFDGTTWNTTTYTTTTPAYALYANPYDLRVRITSGTAGATLAGYGVFYEEDSLVIPVAAAPSYDPTAYTADGNVTVALKTIGVDTTMTGTEQYVRLQATGSTSFTVTLPALSAVALGRKYIFKNVHASVAAVLKGNGSDLIDGANTYTINTSSVAKESIQVVNAGSTWDII